MKIEHQPSPLSNEESRVFAALYDQAVVDVHRESEAASESMTPMEIVCHNAKVAIDDAEISFFYWLRRLFGWWK